MSQLTAAIGSEWTKLRTLRSTGWTAAAIALATVGVAILVAATDSLAPTDTVLAAALANAGVGQIAAGVLGVLCVTGEYGSGTIRATLAACPRRLTVVAAKSLVVTAAVFAIALAASLAAYAAAALLLTGPDRPSGLAAPAVLGVALSFALVALLGLAVGTAVRHTAAAVAAIIGVLLLPGMLGPLIGDWFAELSPIAALPQLTQPGGGWSGEGWSTVAIVGAYTLLAWAGGAWLLVRRDA